MTTKRLLWDITIAGVTLFAAYEIITHIEKKEEKTETSESNTTEDNVSDETTEKKSFVKAMKQRAKKIGKSLQDFAAKVKPYLVQYSDVIEIIGRVTPLISFVSAVITLRHAIKQGKSVPTSGLNIRTLSQEERSSKGIDATIKSLIEDPAVEEFLNYTVDMTDGGCWMSPDRSKYISYTVQEDAA